MFKAEEKRVIERTLKNMANEFLEFVSRQDELHKESQRVSEKFAQVEKNWNQFCLRRWRHYKPNKEALGLTIERHIKQIADLSKKEQIGQQVLTDHPNGL